MAVRWMRANRRERPALRRSQDDPGAFAEVYDEFASKLLRFFATRLDNHQDAVDLTAETLASAYESRGKFRGSTADEAAAWVWSVARTKLARYWRHRSIDYSAMQRVGLERQVAEDHELERIDELLELEAASQLIKEALAELPLEQQRVIRMRYLDELSDRAIADKLEVSPEVVRTRAFRGLSTLRLHNRLRHALSDADGAS